MRRGVKGSGGRSGAACHPSPVPAWGRACRPGTGPVHVRRVGLRRTVTMLELLAFISYLLTLYIYIIFAAVILSWLMVFNVVNPRNRFVAMLAEFLYRITEPVLGPIRRLLPNLGGIDISPLIVILIIFFIQSVIIPNLAKALI
jgi:YggT family protein